MVAKIQVGGLREFKRQLKAADAGLPKMLRLVLNRASGVVIDYAQPRIPRVSGRAAASLKARSSQTEVRVATGGTRAAYEPWLDFGGEGRLPGRPAARPFIREGRYLYKALEVKRVQITDEMSQGLAELAREAGFEVS